MLNQHFHGGDLRAAEKQFGRKPSEWLDLSTGISPWSYPIDTVPEFVWRTLPYDNVALITAAAEYYQCSEKAITPVSGSQDAIRRLPCLLTPSTVAIPAIGYQEHRLAWMAAGHEVLLYFTQAELQGLVSQHRVEHVVIINPNNPTAEIMEADFYARLLCQLPGSGYLIIDEAFVDFCPDKSAVTFLNNPKVIILRSVGKFFGLAGLRLGFVLGEGPVVEHLRDDTMPWGVNHPALWIGAKALADSHWQFKQRQLIEQQQDWLVDLLTHYLPDSVIFSAGLFVTVFDKVDVLHTLYLKAAEAGILLRYDTFLDKNSLPNADAWLRVGLPGDQSESLQQFLVHL